MFKASVLCCILVAELLKQTQFAIELNITLDLVALCVFFNKIKDLSINAYDLKQQKYSVVQTKATTSVSLIPNC